MKAFLDALERFLTWFFAIAFGVILVYAGVRYSHHREKSNDPWLLAQKANTIEAYAAFLRQCQGCPKEEDARKALDELQQRQGLISRLSRDHLSERASITLPSFSSDGHLILATTGKGPDFWESETGHRASFGENTFSNGKGRIQVDTLSLAPDGRRVAAGTGGDEGGRLYMWELSSETKISEQAVDGYDVKTVLFSPDNNWLGWRGDGPVGLWNPATQKFFRGNHDGVKSIAFLESRDGGVYLLTAGDRELWVWDTEGLGLQRQGGVDTERPLLGLSHDGRVVAHTNGRVLEIWDTESRQLLGELRDLEGTIIKFCRNSENGQLVIGTDTGLIYLWDPEGSPLPIAHVSAHEGPIEDLACGAGGRLVSVGWDGAKVWSLEKLASSPAKESAAEPPQNKKSH
jgi:WD40 repeat protein